MHKLRPKYTFLIQNALMWLKMNDSSPKCTKVYQNTLNITKLHKPKKKLYIFNPKYTYIAQNA